MPRQEVDVKFFAVPMVEGGESEEGFVLMVDVMLIVRQ